ncbi:hypothetical protein VTH06DRAFT_6736 [Thermothelomyces fergusii]
MGCIDSAGRVPSALPDEQLASPLFAKLPPELRTIIFTELFGGRRLHLEFMPHPVRADKVGNRRRWRHGICEDQIATPFGRVIARQHHCLTAARRRALDVSIMFTCRRALLEGIPVLYHSNVFLIINSGSRRLPVDDIRSLQAKMPKHWPLVQSLEIKWEVAVFDRNQTTMVPHFGGRDAYEAFWDSLAEMRSLSRLRIALLMPPCPLTDSTSPALDMPSLYLGPIQRLRSLQLCEVAMPRSYLSASGQGEWEDLMSRTGKGQRRISCVADIPLPSFDPGIFDNELMKLRLYPIIDPQDPSVIREPEGNIREGTYWGTQVALTQAYSRIEQTFASLLNILGPEATLPRFRTLEEQKSLYRFSAYPTNADESLARYPPHLEHIPSDQSVSVFQIFDVAGLVETQVLLKKIIPDEEGILGRTREWLLERERAVAYGGEPYKGVSIQDVVDYNRYHRKFGTDIEGGGNIGLLRDWFGDRRFADQQFTGTNPTTITRATPAWIAEFTAAARAGKYDEWAAVLAKSDPKSFFVQDGSYFRKAVGVSDPTRVLHHKEPSSDECWTVGAVSLFQLHDDGKLHPVAICIDYRESLDKSVTIFNKRMSPRDSTSGEKEDWPWRYAKTCAQVTDWMRHELAVHLTLSHFLEEAIIVATNRSLPMDHPVYRLLYPHWYKTLSLNAAARSTLVPQVIVEIVGLSPDQCYRFINNAYDTYDFVGSYVPNDLKRRGFPNTQLGLSHLRYKNYPYAKNALSLWTSIRAYVKAMLHISFPSDTCVVADENIQQWVNEARTAAHIPSFPEIKTLDALVDAVTMCIFIASPFHTAVNYLQNFYQAFVIAKPPALCSPPPTTLEELLKYKEHDLIAALPINRQRQWLLAAQVPWLLSFKVEPDRSLFNYAASQWYIYKYKRGEDEVRVKRASERLYSDLQQMQKTFFRNSLAMDKGSIPYMVLDPGLTAVSILI